MDVSQWEPCKCRSSIRQHEGFEVFSSPLSTSASATLPASVFSPCRTRTPHSTGSAFDITDATSRYFVIDVRSLHDDTNPNGNNHASFGEIAFEAAREPRQRLCRLDRRIQCRRPAVSMTTSTTTACRNAVENLMGTSPEVFNPGLTSVSASERQSGVPPHAQFHPGFGFDRFLRIGPPIWWTGMSPAQTPAAPP